MRDLSEASKSITTLKAMLDRDVEANVRNAGSHMRNLLRVKRGIDMVRLLFEKIVVTEYVFVAHSTPLTIISDHGNGYSFVEIGS